MNISVDFDVKNNVLRGTLQGAMTGAILLDFYTRAEQFMASRPPCRGILDFSGVTEFEVSSQAIRKIAATPPLLPPGYMRVLVIPQIFIFGLARMFQILGEKNRPELQVVRTMDEAFDLLGVRYPDFQPVNAPLSFCFLFSSFPARVDSVSRKIRGQNTSFESCCQWVRAIVISLTMAGAQCHRERGGDGL